MAVFNGPVRCSWCGRLYSFRYGYDGKNIFVLTWDLLTFFWFWWHPHFCSNSCKLEYQQNKGEIGIQRDISKIKSAASFLKGLKPQKAGNSPKVSPLIPQEQITTRSESSEKSVAVAVVPDEGDDKKDVQTQNLKPDQDTSIKIPALDKTDIPAEKPMEKPEDRYTYLREDDRIYRALRFKTKKGFFKHILPSSWIVTIGFYGLVALLILFIIGSFAFQTNSQLLIIIVSNLTMIVIPIILLIIGIKNRVKYMKEKKIWKECTGNGKQKIEDVYVEFEKLEKVFLGL
jgi:hypothetical protein